ncbi:LacI family DNA-binding transcriptional regulator [Bifidobacterium goeldii]|nr:LacI family DNA-binding transcriptional regulator [Bifidobacterium goeldii]
MKAGAKMAVTLKDVAKKAGVSPATVSYALRGGQYVSPATMKKVMKAAKALGYTTNMSARSLRYGKTKIIEVVVHELDIPYYYSKLAATAVPAINREGYQALVLQTGLDAGNVKEAVDGISNQICDGVILNATGIDANEIKRLSMNRPTVLLDDCTPEPVLDTVMTPNREGARIATRHLIEQGCRSVAAVGIGYVSPTAIGVQVGTSKERFEGVREALAENGMGLTERQCLACDWLVEPGREIAHQLADVGMPFDGLFCASDSLAFGLIRGFADRGIRVPDDVLITGFDGISLGEYTVPSISTVRIDMKDLVDKAIRLLLDRIDGIYDGEPRREVAGYDFVVRGSSTRA